MLNIFRVQSSGSTTTTFMTASVSLRTGHAEMPGYPDILFLIRTYQKIARDSDRIKESARNRDDDDQDGDQILLPINLFFKTLSDADHVELYTMYKYAKSMIDIIEMDTRLEIQDVIQQKIYETIRDLNLAEKLIDFCKTGRFCYPDLNNIGQAPHHTQEKTFLPNDYAELTAISLLSKLMVPIWGEFIHRLDIIGISRLQREKLAFELIEPSLDDGVFERIYQKLHYFSSMRIRDDRKALDTNSTSTLTSYILTHNAVDDRMFESIVMSAIIVKRLATYNCFNQQKNGLPPDAMVYINDGIKRAITTKTQEMKDAMTTMPKRELSQHDTEDNQSILDHASKTSKKPIDVPVTVITAAAEWEIPRLVEELNTPMDAFNNAVHYYHLNGFAISPLCQALVASFVGIRFGGSKPLNFLPPPLYQKLVILLQIYLIKQGMWDIASLVTTKSFEMDIDMPRNPIAIRIETNYKGFSEYVLCQSLFLGFVQKPLVPLNSRIKVKDKDTETIDFIHQIDRLKDWLVSSRHTENTAPVLWDLVGRDTYPIVGSDCVFDENVIRNVCQFYLTFHGGNRPFKE